MSPKQDIQKQQSADGMSSSAMRRRREQAAAAAGSERRADASSSAVAAAGKPAAASSAAASSAAAAAAEVPATPKAEDLQMIGQELVPVSSAGIGVEEKGKKEKQNVGTPAKSSPQPLDGFQTPGQELSLVPVGQELSMVPVETKTPNSKVNGTEEEKVVVPGTSAEGTPNGPVGQPVSLGPSSNVALPPALMQSPGVPLFTPEQLREMDELQRRAPILMHSQERLAELSGFQTRLQQGAALGHLGLSCPGMDLVPRDGHLLAAHGLPTPGTDRAVQDWQEAQRQESMMWRNQLQQSIEYMALQLRASQSENLRLRDELRRAVDGRSHSTFHTPEEVKKGGSGKKEDGTGVQQDSSIRVDEARLEILRAQEELIANMQLAGLQGRGQEEGAVAQQAHEDGAAAPQEGESEDGAESQQESSSESEEWQPPDRSTGKEAPRKRRKSGSKDQTLEVILKLMQGMQTMQQQMMKGREDRKDEAEIVRQVVDLPKLPEWDAETAPIDYADWALCLGAHMGDLSSTSEAWWGKIMDTAKAWYDRHMVLTPIERLTHSPKPTDELKSQKWVRLEKRASALLLACIPESLKEEVISSKQVSTLGIVCKAMIQYQPGGLAERAAILNALEQPQEAQSTGAAVAQLRKWIRWRRRAAELGVSMPGATILVRGVSKLLRKVVGSHPDLSFRLSLARNSLLIDTVPTQESVSQYSEHALAELEQLGLQSKRKIMGQLKPVRR